jgi:metal-dependent hydrolase (beta-lactamase superfamily II)
MKEREEMWQKIEELARLNPQVRFFCHCPGSGAYLELGEEFLEEEYEASRLTNL